MRDIFRIFECRAGQMYQIAFVSCFESAIDYLKICIDSNNKPDVFYFAQQIKVQE